MALNACCTHTHTHTFVLGRGIDRLGLVGSELVDLGNHTSERRIHLARCLGALHCGAALASCGCGSHEPLHALLRALTHSLTGNLGAHKRQLDDDQIAEFLLCVLCDADRGHAVCVDSHPLVLLGEALLACVTARPPALASAISHVNHAHLDAEHTGCNSHAAHTQSAQHVRAQRPRSDSRQHPPCLTQRDSHTPRHKRTPPIIVTSSASRCDAVFCSQLWFTWCRQHARYRVIVLPPVRSAARLALAIPCRPRSTSTAYQ
jgi:hypothetical protein